MNVPTRLGFALAIGGGLLAVSPPLAEAYLLFKLLCLAAGGTLIWVGLLRRSTAFTFTALDRPLIAFWIVMLLSTCASIDPPASVFGIYPQAFYGLLPLGLCAALYYGAAAASDGEAPKEELLSWMLAASVLLGAYGIWQGLFGDSLTGYALPSGRITSTIGNPVMLGTCLALLCPLALHETLEKKSLLGAASLGLILVALVMTWARGAWLSAAAAVAFYFWATGRLRLSRRRALGLAVAAPLVFFALQRGLAKRDSDSLRLETVKGALAAFTARPLLGFGPDTFAIFFRRYKTEEFVRLSHMANIGQFNAHNDLLQAATTLGIFGLLAYVWLLWTLAARLRAQLFAPDPDARTAAIAAGLLGLFISAEFNPVPISALALAAIMAGLVCRDRRISSAGAGRAAAALAAALCALSTVVCARFCAANRLFLRGERAVAANQIGSAAYMAGVADLRRANELNPWLLDYLAKRVDVIFSASEAAAPEQGRQLIDKALELTAEALRLHPGNPTAHEMRASALAMSARFGSKRLPEALAEIKTASELDPTFTFTMRRRMDIDRALGDDADFQLTRARYLHVIPLTHESPGWNSPNF